MLSNHTQLCLWNQIPSIFCPTAVWFCCLFVVFCFLQIYVHVCAWSNQWHPQRLPLSTPCATLGKLLRLPQSQWVIKQHAIDLCIALVISSVQLPAQGIDFYAIHSKPSYITPFHSMPINPNKWFCALLSELSLKFNPLPLYASINLQPYPIPTDAIKDWEVTNFK